MRAFAGFKQTGVDYVRPERMFGVTTNSLLKNIGWAKKGILSFSNTPLNMMSFSGVVLLGLCTLLGLVQIVLRLLFPDAVPPGITTTLLTILFFGSLNFFGIGILGEYLAKVFEEVKRRPHFIRRSVIRDGEIRSVIRRSPQDDESRPMTELLEPHQPGRAPIRILAVHLAYKRVNTPLARLEAAARRFLDLQAGSIWNDLVVLLPQSRGMVSTSGCGAQPYRHLLPPGATYKAIDYAGAERTLRILDAGHDLLRGRQVAYPRRIGRRDPVHRDNGARPRALQSSWPRHFVA